MGAHLIEGEFQSDKYDCPRGKVPLSCKDVTAQDLLFEYAQRRRRIDSEFTTDLVAALRLAGFKDTPAHVHDYGFPSLCNSCFWLLRCEEKSVVRQTMMPTWTCELCGTEKRPSEHIYVVDGKYLMKFAAAVMPLAARAAAFALSLRGEPFDETGLPNDSQWMKVVEELEMVLGKP